MKNITISILSLCLTGCSINLSMVHPEYRGEAKYQLIDQRPQSDKNSAHNAAAGFPGYILSDESFTPDRFSILSDRLSQKISREVNIKVVTVRRLQSIEYHPNQLVIDRMINGEITTDPIFLRQIRQGEYRYWAVCILEVEINGTIYSGIGVKGYNGPLVDYPGNHRFVLLSAIDQVAVKVNNDIPNKPVARNLSASPHGLGP